MPLAISRGLNFNKTRVDARGELALLHQGLVQGRPTAARECRTPRRETYPLAHGGRGWQKR